MKRYQLYLNPYSVGILDDVEKISSISRSKLIRHMIDRVSEEMVEVLRIIYGKKKSWDKPIFDSLAGFVDLKTKKKTNFAQNIDEIYLTD